MSSPSSPWPLDSRCVTCPLHGLHPPLEGTTDSFPTLFLPNQQFDFAVTRKDGKPSAVSANLRHIMPHIGYFFLSLVAIVRISLLTFLRSEEVEPLHSLPAALPFALYMLGLNLWGLNAPIQFFASHSSPFNNFRDFAKARGLLEPKKAKAC